MEPSNPLTDGLPNGGRDPVSGRFTVGNPGGRGGDPLAVKTARLRAALVKAVSSRDIRAIVRKLVAQAVAGETASAKLVLYLTVGRPATTLDLAVTTPLTDGERQERMRVAVENCRRVLGVSFKGDGDNGRRGV
jgi:hypothetical protein